MSKGSYSASHTRPGKGVEYEANFERFAWRKWLWLREQSYLGEVVEEHLQGGVELHLDFACGTGRLLRYLQPVAQSSVGVDVSDDMLAECRRLVPEAIIIKADIAQGDVCGIPLATLITAFRFFANANEDLRLAALSFFRANLKPGGLLIVNNHKNAWSLALLARRLLRRRPMTLSPHHMRDLLGRHGFRIVGMKSWGVLACSEKRMWLPAWLHSMADALVRAVGLGEALCHATVYVCRADRAASALAGSPDVPAMPGCEVSR